MKVFTNTHLARVRSRQDAFWRNGPPPEYLKSEQVPSNAGWFYAQKAVAFLAALERTHSIRASKTEADMDNFTYMTLAERSAWFCESINRVAGEMTHEMLFTAPARATGQPALDEDGNVKKDAFGRMVYGGGSVPLTIALMNGSVGSIDALDAGLTDADISSVPPLLPSNIDQHRQLQIDDCRLALDALRPAVRAGDQRAIDSFTKVQDRLAKLTGADAPKQTVSYIGGGKLLDRLTDEELEAIARGGLTLKQQQDGTYSADEA